MTKETGNQVIFANGETVSTISAAHLTAMIRLLCVYNRNYTREMQLGNKDDMRNWQNKCIELEARLKAYTGVDYMSAAVEDEFAKLIQEI